MKVILCIFLYFIIGICIFCIFEKIDRHLNSLGREPRFFTIESREYNIWYVNSLSLSIYVIFWPGVTFVALIYMSYLLLRKLFKLP